LRLSRRPLPHFQRQASRCLIRKEDSSLSQFEDHAGAAVFSMHLNKALHLPVGGFFFQHEGTQLPPLSMETQDRGNFAYKQAGHGTHCRPDRSHWEMSIANDVLASAVSLLCDGWRLHLRTTTPVGSRVCLRDSKTERVCRRCTEWADERALSAQQDQPRSKVNHSAQSLQCQPDSLVVIAV